MAPSTSEGLLTPAQVCAAFSLVYGSVRDFHPAFERLLPTTSPDQTWSCRVAGALRGLLAAYPQAPVPAAAVHTALHILISTLGDAATRMLPLQPDLRTANAPETAVGGPVVSVDRQDEGAARLVLNLSRATAPEVQRELRAALQQLDASELILDLGASAGPWPQTDPLPDWRGPAWRTTQAATRLGAIGEVILKLFGTGGGTRVTLAARQHIGLEQSGVDPIIHADVRPLEGRYQSGHFVRRRRPLPTDAPAFAGQLTVLVPSAALPWLEPALLELQARPSTTVTVAEGPGWAAYGHLTRLPGNLCLETRRWSLVGAQGDLLPLSPKGAAPTDRGLVQVAALLALHHTIRTYNPYFSPDRHDPAWAEALAAAVREAMAAGEQGLPDERFGVLLWDLAAEFPGGHTRTIGPLSTRRTPFLPGNVAPPVLLEITAENEVEIGAVLQDCGVRPGDRIISVDGEDADTRFRTFVHHLRVYTTAAARFCAARWLLAGPPDRPAQVIVQRPDGERLSLALTRSQAVEELALKHAFQEHDAVRVIAYDGHAIGYIDLGRIAAYEMDLALGLVSQADALVFDMRGYPSAGTPDFSRFFPTGESYAFTAKKPLLTAPVEWQGRRSGWVEDVFEQVNPDQTGQDARPLAVLCFGGTASDAEGAVDILRATGRATVVGTQTKGASGAPVWASLPGGATLQFSGSVTTHQGRPSFESRGLQPDIECWPTAAGLAERRDEVLEQAIRILAERLHQAT